MVSRNFCSIPLPLGWLWILRPLESKTIFYSCLPLHHNSSQEEISDCLYHIIFSSFNLEFFEVLSCCGYTLKTNFINFAYKEKQKYKHIYYHLLYTTCWLRSKDMMNIKYLPGPELKPWQIQIPKTDQGEPKLTQLNYCQLN